MNSYDARVRYTRKVIEDSFLSLLQHKHITKITVTELCHIAQINRATFYKHYADVPQLLEKLEERLFDQIRTVFRDHSVSLEAFLLDMLAYTKSEGMRFMVLGSENGDPNLMAKTLMICYETAYPILEKSMSSGTEKDRQILYHFLSHGSGGILTHWIQNGMQEPPEDIVKFILKLCGGAATAFEKMSMN